METLSNSNSDFLEMFKFQVTVPYLLLSKQVEILKKRFISDFGFLLFGNKARFWNSFINDPLGSCIPGHPITTLTKVFINFPLFLLPILCPEAFSPDPWTFLFNFPSSPSKFYIKIVVIDFICFRSFYINFFLSYCPPTWLSPSRGCSHFIKKISILYIT